MKNIKKVVKLIFVFLSILICSGKNILLPQQIIIYLAIGMLQKAITHANPLRESRDTTKADRNRKIGPR